MNNFRFLTLLLFCLLSTIGWAQNCLDYDPIDQAICSSCSPLPWTGISGTEEIDDINQFSNCTIVPVESPSGGTFVGLNIFPGFTEGITQDNNI